MLVPVYVINCHCVLNLGSYLEPDFSGALYANIRIATDLASSVATSSTTLVANVTPASPEISESVAVVASSATTLVISGFGLNNVSTGEGSVSLRSGNTNRAVAATVLFPTSRTQVTAQFLDLSIADAGPLFAKLLVDYGGDSRLETAETQVATIVVRCC